MSRAELENLLERESAKSASRWIWSHHEPPEGARVSWSGKKLLGDPFLREWINRFQPDLVLSGHIHSAPFYPESSWIDRIGKTWKIFVYSVEPARNQFADVQTNSR